MFRKIGLCIAAMMMVYPVMAKAAFVGELELLPPGCEASGNCTLGQEFGFVDSGNNGWMAKKGLLTDGASIPPWAQPIVGNPFEKAFIKAAVIHDHYCDRHVRPWRQTHRVFYDALLESGVSKSKAGIMYFAILVGGPKWVKLVKGKPCALGFSCINKVEIGSSLPGAGIALGEESDVFLTRPSTYGSAQFTNIMTKEIPALEQKGEELQPEQVELEAAKSMAGDIYFINGEEIGGDIGGKVEFK
ncbi:DUF1353 domain-containing protein [Rhizobium laguerreae]|uniref:DUF1353 domain-containing protein n=1 Tax=Rhizobium laguerreae TaxID=1076926 RepID=UPI001C90AD6E|nr:DUF1353 domain-containing protein [Rhizobium laguerreae]MBY3181362.1 DUF1353 domain-containing protein [Rhizobium laguerreae]